MDRFTVIHDDNGSLKDYSIIAENFIVDSFLLPLSATEDYLYIGLYKPFSFLWAEFINVNTQANILSGEYFNGTSWVSLSSFVDRTNGFTRSGFLEWDLDQTSWTGTSIGGETKYWVRFRPNVDMIAGTELAGMSILFSCDNDLLEDVGHINKFLPVGRTSFVQYHQSVKKDIIRQINNMGRKKRSGLVSSFKAVTEFDLLKPEELRQAAKYRCLEKIYFNVSDNPEDKYYQRYLDYRAMASDAFDLYYLTIDEDDDGEVDITEENRINRVKINIL